MPRTFVAHVSNADEAFPRLKQWADNNGYSVQGNAAAGTFRGMPRGLGGILYGEISGAYAANGNAVTIRVNKDLPTGPVANALLKQGLRLVKAE